MKQEKNYTKKCIWVHHVHDSLSFKHEITLDGLTYHYKQLISQSIIKSSMFTFS